MHFSVCICRVSLQMSYCLCCTDVITNGRIDAKEFSDCSESERIVDVISGEVMDFLVREYNVQP